MATVTVAYSIPQGIILRLPGSSADKPPVVVKGLSTPVDAAFYQAWAFWNAKFGMAGNNMVFTTQ